MFGQILYTQWKWSRATLAIATVIVFALPVLAVQPVGRALGPWEAMEILQDVSSWSGWFALSAMMLGLLAATVAWSSDHKGRHVYALSLPLPRWHYVLLRYGAGLVLLAAPLAALWIGSLLATASVTLPAGLRTYPNALALRFALAALIAYSTFFAITAATTRTAGYVLGILAGLFALQLLLVASGLGVNILEGLFGYLTTWPGPFEVFTGRWMLIDV